MTISIHDELDTLYDKFDHAERKWLNRFDELDGHYDKAVRDFTSNLPKGSSSTAAQDTLDIGIGALGLSGGPAIIAVPVFVGLKKLASLVDGEVSPPAPDLVSFQSKFKDIRKAFKGTAEHIGDEIIKLKDKAKQSAKASDELQIRDGMSKILLSPIWYPPSSTVTANPGIARAFEMRMWFSYFGQLVKLSPGKQMQLPGWGGIDYSPMYKRFKDIVFEPAGVQIERRVMPFGGSVWMAKGDNHNTFKVLNAYGEKNKEFKMQHSYPADVEKYLLMMKGSMSAAQFFNGQKQLPPSALRWADVTF